MKKPKNELTCTTTSPSETQRLAAALAPSLSPGDVILLIANLGSGKTTFVQGLTKALGVKDRALSPTFVLAQTLKGKLAVHHLDFYRVKPKELLAMGLDDYLIGRGEIEKGVVLIEWADLCREVWPKNRLEVRLKINRDESRQISFRARGSQFQKILSKLEVRVRDLAFD